MRINEVPAGLVTPTHFVQIWICYRALIGASKTVKKIRARYLFGNYRGECKYPKMLFFVFKWKEMKAFTPFFR